MRLDRGRLRALMPLWLIAAAVGWLLWSLGNAKPFLDDGLRLLEVVGGAALVYVTVRALRGRGKGDRRRTERRRAARRDEREPPEEAPDPSER